MFYLCHVNYFIYVKFFIYFIYLNLGWNVNGVIPAAENELDMPMCSWGTGHASPEQCPYQYPSKFKFNILDVALKIPLFDF